MMILIIWTAMVACVVGARDVDLADQVAQLTSKMKEMEYKNTAQMHEMESKNSLLTAQLTSRMQEMEYKVTTQMKKEREHAAQMMDMEAQFSRRIHEMKSKAIDQMEKEEQHAAQMMEMEANVNNQMQEMKSEHADQILEMQDQINYLETRLKTTNVMFSVYMTVNDFYPAVGDVLPFDGVTVNQGNHFNTQSYRFTCPIKGMYYFSYSIYSNAIGGTELAYRSSASLYISGQVLNQVYSENKDPDYFIRHQGSNDVIVECGAGDEVWIQADWDGNRIQGTSSYYRHTTFTGFMLSNLEP